MPTHVYHEVDVAALGGGRYWLSWGNSSGEIHTEDGVLQLFAQEFTFDSRYSVVIHQQHPAPPIPVLCCFVSSGGDDRTGCGIYAYEITNRGDYNAPLENGWTKTLIEHWQGASERHALIAMAHLLLAEAERRRGLAQEAE